MTITSALEHLEELTNTVPAWLSEEEARKLTEQVKAGTYQALATIEQSPLSDALKERCRHAVDTLAEAFEHNLRTWRTSALALAAAKAPNAAMTQSRLDAARDHLKALTESLPTAIAPMGYTVSDLCAKAEISNGTFDKIRAMAGLSPNRRGDTTHRYSAEDVRKLVEMAPIAAPRRGKQAQIAWIELIEATPQG